MSDEKEKDSRYPYTYACDWMRMIPERDGLSCKLSRADASQIRSKIATVLGISDEELAKKLADAFLENERDGTYAKEAEAAANAAIRLMSQPR